MKEFLKTFGKGILYFLLSPILLLVLIIYGIYLFFVNFFTFFKLIKSKKKNEIKEMDEHALNILKANRFKDDSILKEETHNYQTTNNVIITNKEDLEELLKQVSMKKENNLKIEQNNDQNLITNVKENEIIEIASPSKVDGNDIRRVE